MQLKPQTLDRSVWLRGIRLWHKCTKLPYLSDLSLLISKRRVLTFSSEPRFINYA